MQEGRWCMLGDCATALSEEAVCGGSCCFEHSASWRLHEFGVTLGAHPAGSVCGCEVACRCGVC